ncbi:MAG TPA: vWA domain-containing protein [Nannocystaceae bacterium]|nr:vWA domain-containing protein [Nannocystaceae bacterium]
MVAVVAVVAAAGCGRTPVWIRPSDDLGGTGGSESDGPGMTETSAGSTGMDVVECDPTLDTCPIELKLRRAVDILFVVDNSGSMGGEQGTLAQSFASFVDVLESQQVGANYRIGVTTTAGDGILRATSCRSRLQDFVFSWQFGDLDERQRGCLDHCDHDVLDIPQPWVEKSEGATNLPPGVSMTEALQCIGPPGINGPGYESPLESMRMVIEDPTSGFLRQDALLAVIFLTDEADCSASFEEQSWLGAEGVPFWTTPERSTSGACWNAGVTCTGGPGIYDDCVPQDKDRSGGITLDPEAAVLYPVQRYIDEINALAQKKQAEGGQGQVLLALIAGVPLDYPETGVIVYQDSDMPDFNIEYGIGPACDRGTETVNDPPGIPDVRLRQVVESFATDDPNVFSICSDDYGVALESIAAAIGDISERACVGGCVADLAPDEGLQPDCALIERFAPDAGQADRLVAPCTVTDEGWDFPNANADACYRALVDVDGSTPTTVDDMTSQCITRGFNLELLVERRPGVPIPSGTAIDVNCNLLAEPGIKCEDV